MNFVAGLGGGVFPFIGAAAVRDPAVDTYLSNIEANSGNPDIPNLKAIHRFFRGLKDQGLWDRIDEGSLFLRPNGSSSAYLATCLSKFKWLSGAATILSNVGGLYTSSDVLATGLDGGSGAAGSSKYADTGYSIPTLGQYDFHLGVQVSEVISGNSGLIGSSYSATGNSDRFYITQKGSAGFGSFAVGDYISSGLNGLWMERGSTAVLSTYLNGSGGLFYSQCGAVMSSANSSGVDGRQTGTVLINRAAGLSGNTACIGAYTIGKGLTAAQATVYDNLFFQLRLDMLRG